LRFKRSQMLPVMGQLQKVDTAIGDYRVVQGVKVPHRFESAVAGAPQKMVIVLDAVEFNPKIERSRFDKP